MKENIRQLFPITQSLVYLNHAAVSPPPVAATVAIESQLKDVQTNGSLNYRSWVATKESCRQLLAKLLNARANQIAFMRNTSDALSCVANGLKWHSGENIVTFANEFPSNVYPWRRIRDVYNVELRFCPERNNRIDLDEFCSLIDENTKIVSISAVQYASGFRANLRKLAERAREFDALLVVDAIQAAGVVPLDMEKDAVDVFAGACHKWLLTPEGIGYLVLSDRARTRLEPTLIGWISVKNPEDYSDFEQELKSGALPWETGTFASSLFYGLEANLKIIDEIGVEKINAYLLELTDALCEKIDLSGEQKIINYRVASSRLDTEKSPIVCLEHARGYSANEIYKHLLKQKIVVAPRGTCLRISPHFYNDLTDIEKLIAALP